MAWVNPKTNWTANDYYNIEDAERIINNIEYLRERAKQLYPSEIVGFLPRGIIEGTMYFKGIDLSPNDTNMEVETGITIGEYMRLSAYDDINYLTLFKLSMLPNPSDVDTLNIYCDYDIGILSPRYNYSGYGVILAEGVNEVTLDSLWTGSYMNNMPRKMFNEVLFNQNEYAYIKAGDFLLYNQPFWNYNELNKIELVTQNVYDKLA